MTTADRFRLDLDQLHALASERIVRRGIDYFKDHRVTDLSWDDRSVRATVEGSRAFHPYAVELTLDEDGEICVDCTCPFDWEPACKHAVATLLAYGARQPVEELEVESAADEAVEARVKRGRTEVKVRHVSGDRWFGTWSAQSVSSKRAGLRPWQVEIRSVSERINHCTCPDFAVNRLGTCKHVEAVLHRLRTKAPKRFARMAAKGPSVPVVHLAWDVPAAPRIRVHRPRKLAPDLAEVLDRCFDDEGFLVGALPHAFHRLHRELRARDDVLVGSDAVEHARRVGEEAHHRLRAHEIHRQISRSGGHLDGVRARLYPYQVEGVAFLASTGRALLADDMGLGKTLQAVAAATWLSRHEGVRRTLVVCPASLKHQWAREAERFTSMSVQVVQGPPAQRRRQYRLGAELTVVNYELVLRDAAAIQEHLAPDLLVLDEAQRIKNWRTKTAAAVKSLRTRYAFVLTGTPLENRLEDLYSLMQVVDPRVLGPLWRYAIDFHVTNERGRVLGYRNLSELRRRLEPVMLRRDRSLVRAQLPDRIQQQLDVPLDATQQDLHDEALATAGNIARRARKRPLTPIEEQMLMAALQRTRMACDAAGLVDGETVGSPKLDELGRILEDLCVEAGRKVVVFSQWERMTAMAEQRVRDLGLGCVRLHGGVPTARRGDLLDRFRDDPEVAVFLSTDAGGVGLNLQAASALVNLDMPWNPAVLEQRIARVHRLGQPEVVNVLLLLAADSYEQKVAAAVASKQFLFDNVVDPEATEDVVGMSKRMIETALVSLGDEEQAAPGVEAAGEAEPGEAEPDELEEPEVVEAAEVEVVVEAEPAEVMEADEPEPAAQVEPLAAGLPEDTLAPVVVRLQEVLGSRIERLLAAGAGLVVVVDVVDPAAEKAVAGLGTEFPVEVVDRRTAAALSRLGALSGRSVDLPTVPSGPPPLLGLARRKLDAGEVMVEQGFTAEAAELMTMAMLAAASHRAGLDAPIAAESAAVWAYGEAVPRGWCSADDAAALTRAAALVRAPEVPDPLLQLVAADARRLVGVEEAVA